MSEALRNFCVSAPPKKQEIWSLSTPARGASAGVGSTVLGWGRGCAALSPGALWANPVEPWTKRAAISNNAAAPPARQP